MTVAGYPRYESYKDSGVEWIGEVPNDWDVTPGRACVYGNKDKNTGLIENQVLSLSYGRIIKKEAEDLTGLVPESFETYQLVKPGDIIIRGTDLQNDKTSLRTGLAKDVGIITSAYINLRPKKNSSAEYLHYLLHSYDVKKVFYALGSGLRQNLSYLDFKYLKIPLPTLQEQKFITAFLDEKCNKIDEAICIKEEQIKLLHERRQILIQQAVTRGLNPDAPMKDSGIDWIGQIPAHWKIERIKWNIETTSGFAFKSTEYSTDDNEIRLLRGINVNPGKTNWDETVYWPKNKLIGFESLLLKEEDIAIAMDRPWISSGIRVHKITKDDLPALLLQRVGRIRVKSHITSSYLYETLRTSLFLNYFEPILSGISVPHISFEQISNFTMAIPPKSEQQEITIFIEKIQKSIKASTKIKNQQITALKEYKTTLINAAVTGKIRITPDMLSTSAN